MTSFTTFFSQVHQRTPSMMSASQHVRPAASLCNQIQSFVRRVARTPPLVPHSVHNAVQSEKIEQNSATNAELLSVVDLCLTDASLLRWPHPLFEKPERFWTGLRRTNSGQRIRISKF